MWSYCALTVGHDGIDSPIWTACSTTRHKTILRYVSPDEEPRHLHSIEKIQEQRDKASALQVPSVPRFTIA